MRRSIRISEHSYQVRAEIAGVGKLADHRGEVLLDADEQRRRIVLDPVARAPLMSVAADLFEVFSSTGALQACSVRA